MVPAGHLGHCSSGPSLTRYKRHHHPRHFSLLQDPRAAVTACPSRITGFYKSTHEPIACQVSLLSCTISCYPLLFVIIRYCLVLCLRPRFQSQRVTPDLSRSAPVFPLTPFLPLSPPSPPFHFPRMWRTIPRTIPSPNPPDSSPSSHSQPTSLPTNIMTK